MSSWHKSQDHLCTGLILASGLSKLTLSISIETNFTGGEVNPSLDVLFNSSRFPFSSIHLAGKVQGKMAVSEVSNCFQGFYWLKDLRNVDQLKRGVKPPTGKWCFRENL